MSKWDYMDNKVWKSSEVMKELEKIYIKQAQDKLDVKQAQDKIGDVTKKINELKAAVVETGKAMKDALPADDGAVKEKPKSKKRKRITEKDHKLVYSIERAIESLEEED